MDGVVKDGVAIVYTGEGKGKTSASLGLMLRALGAGMSVAYLQFIKSWEVSEHAAIAELEKVYGAKLKFRKGGKGFYNAGDLSAKNVTEKEHRAAARDLFKEALSLVKSGQWDLIICDEINNAVSDGLLEEGNLEDLLKVRDPKTSLCLTGRNFPKRLINQVDIATEMVKLKHHYDDGFLANKGIDY